MTTNLQLAIPEASPVPNNQRLKDETVLGLFTEFFRSTYEYREYLKQSVARDLRKRYKRSVLGYAWSMLHPLLMMAILAVVFSNVMKFSTRDYAVFVFAGMLPWNYFANTTLGALGVIRGNAPIIDQVPVPKYIFVLSIAFSNLVNLLLSVVPLLIVMVCLGHSIPWTILALPLVLVPLFFITAGLAILLAVGNVFFEDVTHLTGLAVQALYFLCPVLYGREVLPKWLTPWVVANPLFGLIESMRDLFYKGILPDPGAYALNFFGCLAVLGFSLWVFRRSDDKLLYFM